MLGYSLDRGFIISKLARILMALAVHGLLYQTRFTGSTLEHSACNHVDVWTLRTGCTCK